MMKKINTSKKSSALKLLIIATGVIIALAIASIIYVYAFDGNLFGWKKETETTEEDVKKIDLNPATNEQIEAGNRIKEDSLNNDTTQSPTSNSIDVSITAANQNGASLQVRALISSLANSGTCTLILSKDGREVTHTAAIQALSSTSTCQGFDIPTSELSSGKWSVKIDVATGTSSGSVTTEVTINES